MYKSCVKKTQTEAKVVAYSISKETGEKIITFELQYPRLVHSEVMTHRLFTRNAASSRAIPVSKSIEMVRECPAMPVRFGANQTGMQDKGEEHIYAFVAHSLAVEYEGNTGAPLCTGREAWKLYADKVAEMASELNEAGYHKQICNRLIEPFQYIKTVVTFTGNGNNFFGLRDHADADPTIEELAKSMREAMELAPMKHLKSGDWHVPYYKDGAFIKGRDKGLQKALKISASCCAQVSYRKLDDSEDKAEVVYDRLVNSKPVHASPFEHQATPLKKSNGFRSKYVTHIDRDGNPWSGNFRNWGQYRQQIEGNVIKDELKEFNE